MTLLGFSMGLSGDAPAAARSSVVNQSLDQMIDARRKETRKLAQVDRAVATSRAKREAAMAAKRGLAPTSAPSAMQIEKAVQAQTKRTAAKNAAEQKKKNSALEAAKKSGAPLRGKTAAERTQARREKQAASRVAVATVSSINNGTRSTEMHQVTHISRPPSKKAVNAAVTAMESKGFQIPPGMSMIISFAPTSDNSAASSPNAKSGGGNQQKASKKQSPPAKSPTAGEGKSRTSNRRRNNNRGKNGTGKGGADKMET